MFVARHWVACLLTMAIATDYMHCTAFVAPSTTVTSLRKDTYRQSLPWVLQASKKGKGFGASSESSAKTTKKEEQTDIATPQPSSVSTNTPPPMNDGQRALAELRRQRAEQKDQELRKVRELIAADEQLQETPAVIPEKVAQRMGKRMLPFVGVPLFLALGSFVLFWYLATYKNVDIRPNLVATSTGGLLFVSLFGITYSLFSASWDEDREGDLFGQEEFKRNVENIREGLSRSRENVLLREQLGRMSEDEVKSALNDLNKRESASSKKQQTLQSKLEEELE